jgi:hypothetical protein
MFSGSGIDFPSPRIWSAARRVWELAAGTDNARQPSEAAFGSLSGHVLSADEETSWHR